MSDKKGSTNKNASPRNKVQKLLKELEHKNFRVKNDAIEALRNIKASEAVNKLYEIVVSPNWNYKHRISAINSLSSKRKEKKFIGTMKTIINNLEEHRELRRSALTHLARLKDPSLTDIFSRALNDDYRFVRFWAVRGLIKLDTPKSKNALVLALGDGDEEIRKDVYMHLEHSDNSIIPYLKSAYNSPDANKFLRYGVVGLLGRIKDKDTIPTLIEALEDGNERVVRIAIRSLGKSNNINAITPLVELYKKEQKYESFIQSSLFKIAQSDMNGSAAIISLFYVENFDNQGFKDMILKTFKNLMPSSVIALGELSTDPKLPKDVKEKIHSLMEKLETD